ncbi:MAG: putative regulatory protein [Conexibacter sp.]|nr:putative regulatory protein [Conexibacter sp.]
MQGVPPRQAGGQDLRRAPSVTPSRANVSSQALIATSAAGYGGAMVAQLRGRELELRAVEQGLADLADGRGSVILVAGGPGAGKTSLLARATELAAGAGVPVFHGAGDPAAEMMPYSPLLDALLNAAEPLLDGTTLRSIAGLPDHRFWLMQELQDRLEQAALQRPLVMVVDDVQWADAATKLALRTLPGRLATHAILWLLAVRPGGEDVTVGHLQASGAQTLALGALDPGAVAEVAADVLGGVADDEIMSLTRDIETSPFLLIELLRGLRDEGQVIVEDGRASLVDHRLPRRFRDTVVQRVLDLSDGARELIQMASVLGRQFSIEQVALVLERSVLTLRAPLQEALAAGLLVEHAGALSFRHDLVREAVDAEFPPGLRTAVRRRAVRLLMEYGAPATEIAVLLADVAEPGDRAAVGVLRQAAVDLSATAPAMAATLASRALELAPAEDPERPGLMADTIPLLFMAGRSSEARAFADSALRGLLSPEHEARVRLRLGQICVQSSLADVGRQCRLALALADVPPSLRLQLRLVLTLGCLLNGDIEDGLAAVEDDLAAARDAGDVGAERAALYNWSLASFYRHRYQDALDYAEARLSLVADERDGQRLLAPGGTAADMWGSWLRGLIGQIDEALPRLEAGLRTAQREGRVADTRWWLSSRCRTLLSAGRLSDARADAETVLELFDDLDGGQSATKNARYVLAAVALYTGDQAALRVAARDAAGMRADDSPNLQRSGIWIEALLADAAGRPAEAIDLLAETVADLGHAEPAFVSPQDYGDVLTLLRIALRAGRADVARLAVVELERRASANPGFALQTLQANHGRGLLEQDPGAMRASVESVGHHPSPIGQARILEDAATVLAPHNREEAIAQFDAAHQRYDTAGAAHDSARVRRALRDLGVRRPRPQTAGPLKGWNALTDAELAVVEVVAEGATNRQTAERLYLSPHTVSSHLRHAFEKLGIRSRVELAVLWLQRDADDASDADPAA